MTNNKGAKFKNSRSVGAQLTFSSKDSFIKRNYPPGQHGTKGYRRGSTYGSQLRSKQKLRKFYDIKEYQFRSIFVEAQRRKGDSGLNFVTLLESRLDSVVLRAKYVKSISHSKQLISHKHILVNDKIVNISSYTLKPGDKVSISKKALSFPFLSESILDGSRKVPDYITFSSSTDQSGTFNSIEAIYNRLPNFEEVNYPMGLKLSDISSIVEYYARLC